MAKSNEMKTQIDILASLIERGNKTSADPLGRCDWTDINGQVRCNNFSEFQCQQAGGVWTANSSCPANIPGVPPALPGRQ
jgi:hypothetical protein